MISPIFLGGGGRVARLANFCWPTGRPWIVARRPESSHDQIWDMVADPPPALRCDGGSAVVCFAGVTPLSGAPLERNGDLALAAVAAARAWGIGQVFVMSSSAVYGDTGSDPAREDRLLAPTNAYGAAKAAMETAVLKAVSGAYAPGVTVLRLANVAGAGQPFDAARQSGGHSIPLHRFADGQGPSRSFVGPVTLARALSALCDLAARGVRLPNVLNLAESEPTAMEEILGALGQPFHWVPAPETALRHVHLDVQKLAQLWRDLPHDSAGARSLVSQVRAATEGVRL